MPLVACPKCGTQLNATAEHLGRSVTCGRCGSLFTATAMGAPGAMPPVPPPLPASVPYAAPLDAGAASYAPPPSSGKAIAALVLGICSIPTCFIYGIPSLICGVLGMVFGKSAERDMDAGVADPGARGMAKAGWICGVIGVVLSAMFWIFAFLFFILNIMAVTGGGSRGTYRYGHP